MWKEVRTPVITVLLIFVGLFVFTKLVGPIPFTVNTISTAKDSPFSVTGEGEATAIPDTAQITMGVNKTAPTVQQAQQQVNTIINQVKSGLTQLGVKETDIKTVNYSVDPNYDYANGNQQLKGYAVNADLQAKIESVEKANQAIDAATKAGATNVGNVQFVLNDKKKTELEDQARKQAIERAKEKAQSLSNAAGVKLGRIVDIKETGGNNQPPVMPMTTTMDRVAGALEKTELNPGENKINITVTLSYETL